MARISLRISDELAEQVKAAAEARKLSVNGYLTYVLRSRRDIEARRQAVEETAGVMTGVYRPDELSQLREDRPE